jgi:regulator of RNase E activity RraA
MLTIMPYPDFLKLARFNTPTVYNGLEAITSHDRTGEYFNLEETVDFLPEAGAMVGRAVTVIAEPSNPEHKTANPNASAEYRTYVASVEGPKIVIVQDRDKPRIIGSFWGEVNASIHKVLGCVGTITDGGVRDLDEMRAMGFKAIAKRTCVGHAYSTPVEWGCEVDVFGCHVKPGQLIHADKHGFLAIPEEDEAGLLDAVTFLDSLEIETTISAARHSTGKSLEETVEAINEASKVFRARKKERFGE